MSKEVPVSVYLITLNEEAHLAEVLEPLGAFSELIVVDSGSTDNTVAIAKAKGAKVYHQDWLGYAKQKAYAMSLCQHKWVINLDGDEVLSQQNISEIKQAINNDEADALRFHFDDLFWGASISKHSRKRTIIRAFKSTHAQYPANRLVHENLIIEDGTRVKSISSLITHFGYDSTDILASKYNSYSSLKALEKFNNGKSPSFSKLLLIYPLSFIKSYFLRKMCFSGKRGIILAHLEASYSFLKEAKLHELKSKNHIE